MFLLFCFFFFFQAEDGIRDRTVTGVQTCALPISGRPVHLLLHDAPAGHEWADSRAGAEAWLTIHAGRQSPRCGLEATGLQEAARSEERRVGKECRCRWGQ